MQSRDVPAWAPRGLWLTAYVSDQRSTKVREVSRSKSYAGGATSSKHLLFVLLHAGGWTQALTSYKSRLSGPPFPRYVSLLLRLEISLACKSTTAVPWPVRLHRWQLIHAQLPYPYPACSVFVSLPLLAMAPFPPCGRCTGEAGGELQEPRAVQGHGRPRRQHPLHRHGRAHDLANCPRDVLRGESGRHRTRGCLMAERPVCV